MYQLIKTRNGWLLSLFIFALTMFSCKKTTPDNPAPPVTDEDADPDKDKDGDKDDEGDDEDDDDNDQDSHVVLPQVIELETAKGVFKYTISYSDEVGTIEKITQENAEVRVFHYEGDLITKVSYEGTSNYLEYEYDGDRLIRETGYRQGEAEVKTEYEYTSDTKVNQVEYRMESGQWKAGNTVTLEFNNKNNLVGGNTVFEDMGAIEISLKYGDILSPLAQVKGLSATVVTGGVPLGDNIGLEDIVGRYNSPVSVLIKSADGNIDITYTYETDLEDHPKYPTSIEGEMAGDFLFSAKITYLIY